MNKEEIEVLKTFKNGLGLTSAEREILGNLIDKQQKEIEQLKEQRKELNLENQALYESINCNDNNMLARRYYRLQKEIEELKNDNIKLLAEISDLKELIKGK